MSFNVWAYAKEKYAHRFGRARRLRNLYHSQDFPRWLDLVLFIEAPSPKACMMSEFGCCWNDANAKGPDGEGCPGGCSCPYPRPTYCYSPALKRTSFKKGDMLKYVAKIWQSADLLQILQILKDPEGKERPRFLTMTGKGNQVGPPNQHRSSHSQTVQWCAWTIDTV